MLFSAMGSLFLSLYAFKSRKHPAMCNLSLLLMAATVWALGYSLELAVTNLQLMKIFTTFTYLGITTIPVFWLIFVARYTGNDGWLTPLNRSLLFIIPSISIVLLATNDLHYFFYSLYELAIFDGFTFSRTEVGPFWWVHTTYSYLVIIVGLWYLVGIYFKVPRANRFVVSIFITSLLLPCIANIAYISGFRPYGFLDITPISFIAMGAILSVGAFTKRVMDVSLLAYDLLFQNLPDIIIVIDAQGNIVNTNPTAQKLLDHKLSRVDTSDAESHNLLLTVQNLAALSDTSEIELNEKIYAVSNTPILSPGNETHGKLIVLHDITERKLAEKALKVSEKKYREILSTIEEGYYEVDLAGNFVFFNDSLCKVLGYKRDELKKASYTKFYENPQEVFITYNRVFRTGKTEKAADWPVITGDGQKVFVELSITLRRDEAGNPIGFRGIARDVTERKLAEEKLHEYEKLQQLLMKMATECINVPLEKVDQTINEMLKAVGEFTKVDRVYIFKHDYNRRVTSNTHEWCSEGITREIDNLQDFPFERFIDYLEAHQKGEVVNIPDVAEMHTNHSLRPIFEAEGIRSMIMLPLFCENINTGFVGFDAVKQKMAFTEQEISLLKVLAEITSNVLTRQKTETNIRYISFHDQLTSLYNRYFLEEEMARIDTARQLPLAVIMADLNGLKLVNDAYGHNIGDEMLKTATNIIRNSCREEDIISRWGGDEFVVLLPQTAAEEARLICKRITEGCQNAYVEGVPVSIALGMASKTSAAKSLVETLREAEDEMYKHKLTESLSTKRVVLATLLNALAEKSFETEEHTKKMQKTAQKIGVKLNLPDNELNRLDLLISLHDVGKINIAEDILTKKGSLTDDECKTIKTHPEIGYRIAMATEEFSHVAEEILTHHERWDGLGYPRRLKGKDIPLLSRITAIADAYELMSHGRPYKKAMSKNKIIAEFRRCSGAHFDPELVEIFLSILEADE